MKNESISDIVDNGIQSIKEKYEKLIFDILDTIKTCSVEDLNEVIKRIEKDIMKKNDFQDD